MSPNAVLNSVRTFLASHHMHVDDEWLAGCVEFLNEDSSNNYSENEIQNLAKEQWLLNDLSDICPGSLPADLKRQHKTVLNGRFVLQINAAMDIGTPAYQQYMKLQKINQENIEATTNFDDKIPSHRMIKLFLTDGVQELSAIEYKPMRNLSCDITPGCKVLVKGPLECRRGVLLLTESSIELLGGEVQEISISNSLAGLLSSKLGLPIPQESNPHLVNYPRNTNIPSPPSQMPPPRREDVEPLEPPETSKPIARVTSVQLANFNDDDIDIDQLAAIEAEYLNKTATREPHVNSANIDNSSKKTTSLQSLQGNKRLQSDSLMNPEKRPRIDQVNTVDDYPDDNDLFLEDDVYLREMEAKFDEKEKLIDNAPTPVSSEPFIYIKQINNMSDSVRAGRVFRVKGQIMKLLSKLSVGKDGWSLSCTIVDGTGSIDVDFTSGVLSKLVGFTPQEMNNLKKQMVTKPELKEKAIAALQKAKDTLQVLYCIIELTMLEVPKITCLIPFEEAHIDLLKRRINQL